MATTATTSNDATTQHDDDVAHAHAPHHYNSLLPNYTKNMPLALLLQELEKEKKASPSSLHFRNRTELKDRILKAYELADAANTMEQMMIYDPNNNDDYYGEGRGRRDKSNPTLVAHFQETIQSMRQQVDDIMAIPDHLLNDWEQKFRKLVQFKMDTNTARTTTTAGSSSTTTTTSSLDEYPKDDDKVMWCQWFTTQRKRRIKAKHFKNADMKQMALDDCEYYLKRIGFDLSITRRVPRHNFDQRFQQLLAYKEQHGDLHVPRRESKLGEFVYLLRSEYNNNNNNNNNNQGAKKAPTHLLPHRIQALNDIGFVWRMVASRPRTRPKPKAGDDPKFQKSPRQEEKEEEEGG
jgi:hypothetical protein